MRSLSTVITVWLLVVCMPVRAARHFRDSRLEKVARTLGIMDSIGTDTFSRTYYINHQQYVVRQGRRGYVEHIGIPLFSQEYRVACPSPVFDCLEFLTLCHQHRLIENQLPLSGIKFFYGNWNLLENIGSMKSVSIETVKDKYYQVKWLENKKTIVELVLPINYELLNCRSRKELNEDFVRKLKDPESAKVQPVDYLQTPHSYYMIPQITQSQAIDGLGNLIYDNFHPQESMANLMLASYDVAPHANMQLELVLDHDKRERLQIPLCRWNALCRAVGCIPYYGNEDVKDGIIRGVQVMNNTPTGYDHILYVECRQGDLGKNNISLKATAYLYVPSSNVKELFAQPKKQQSRTKRQKKL